MSEFSPVWELDPSNWSLPVSDRAMHGLSVDEIITNNDDDSRRARLKAGLVSSDPVLADALGYLIKGWCLTEDVDGYFTDGFTFGHRLLSIEEEIGGSKVPIASDDTVDMFANSLQLNWNGSAEYIYDRLGDVVAQNEKYTEALSEVSPQGSTIEPTKVAVYVLGILNVHDILLQQKCADNMIDVYRGRVNETNIAP